MNFECLYCLALICQIQTTFTDLWLQFNGENLLPALCLVFFCTLPPETMILPIKQAMRN